MNRTEVIVNNAWRLSNIQSGGNVLQGIQKVATDLKDWDENVFGNLQKRIKQLKQDWEDIRRGKLINKG